MSDGTGLFNSEIKLPPEIKNIAVFFLTNNV